MNKITKMIRKVATTARKAVLLGALVGGVSMMAYATETTVGPTMEKAQLEKVNINLDAVVAAITKADPDWVKGLPMVDYYYQYTGPSDNDTDLQNPTYWSYISAGTPPAFPCNGSDPLICTVKLPVDQSGLAGYVDDLTLDDLETEERIITYRDEEPN